MEKATSADILDLARQQGVVTPSDVRLLGLAPENLNRLVKQGLLERAGRGIYQHPEYKWTENHSYVEVAKAVPEAVICLLTALRIYEIGTQNPHRIWISIPYGKRVPKTRTSKLHVVRMSPKQYETGIEHRIIEGVSVPIYSLEKTIIDCFRLRRVVGTDVAIEALKEALRARKVDINMLIKISKSMRAASVVMPYIEALTQ